MDGFRREAALVERVGQAVDAAQAVGLCRRAVDFHLGVGEAESPVEHVGLAEKDVFHARLITIGDGFQPIEPHHLYRPRTVGKQCLQTPFGAFACRVETDEPSADLYVRHFARYVADAVNLAAVNIAKRKIVEQVAIGVDVELLVEQFGAFRTYSGEIFYVDILDFSHYVRR